MHEIIRSLESEIWRIEKIVLILRTRKLYDRANSRACEVRRFRQILDLAKKEYGEGT